MSRYIPIAEYYDAENEHLSMLHQDVPLLLEHLPKKRRSVLALACGTGRAAIPLAQAGHDVTGVDIDPAMLDIAKRKREMVGMDQRSLPLIQADILKLNLRKRFDWVCLLFNTMLNFTELEQLDQLLQTVVRHLKPKGRLWVDVLNPDPHLLAQPELTELDPVLFVAPALGRTVMRTVDIKRDKQQGVQIVTHRYTWFDEQGREHREKLTFRMTFLLPRELRLLLERHALFIEQLYGDYDRSAVGWDSPRLIALARRK